MRSMGAPHSGDDASFRVVAPTPHDGSYKGRITKPSVVVVVVLILFVWPWIDLCIRLLLRKSRLSLHPLALNLRLLWNLYIRRWLHPLVVGST